MSKKYQNHIFQRATTPWRWLAIVSFVIALIASISAFISARNWVSNGSYLQSIDIEQIEVLRLIPALKELQAQTNGAVGLDPSFFNNLKKSDSLFKLQVLPKQGLRQHSHKMRRSKPQAQRLKPPFPKTRYWLFSKK